MIRVMVCTVLCLCALPLPTVAQDVGGQIDLVGRAIGRAAGCLPAGAANPRIEAAKKQAGAMIIRVAASQGAREVLFRRLNDSMYGVILEAYGDQKKFAAQHDCQAVLRSLDDVQAALAGSR